MKRLTAMIFTILLASTFAAFSTAVLAQNYPSEFWNPQALARFIFPKMPAEWLQVPQVIYYVIVPFFTAFVIIYGILKELKIFRGQNKLHAVIAFLFAFLLLPSGILTYIVNIFYAFGAFIGLIGFGILFIIGTFLWIWGRGRGIYYESGIENETLRSIRSDLRDINEKIDRKERELVKERAKKTPDAGKIVSLENELADLRREKKEHIARMERVKEPT